MFFQRFQYSRLPQTTVSSYHQPYHTLAYTHIGMRGIIRFECSTCRVTSARAAGPTTRTARWWRTTAPCCRRTTRCCGCAAGARRPSRARSRSTRTSTGPSGTSRRTRTSTPPPRTSCCGYWLIALPLISYSTINHRTPRE